MPDIVRPRKQINYMQHSRDAYQLYTREQLHRNIQIVEKIREAKAIVKIQKSLMLMEKRTVNYINHWLQRKFTAWFWQKKHFTIKFSHKEVEEFIPITSITNNPNFTY
tara:strand:+ start:1069 stop:1392 length:324 start_codon:yes stop_codon:yes gene_type:complete